MELKNKRIAFLGDSITEGVGADNNYGYVDYVREFTGADCVNFGISGTRIARQKNPTVESPSFDLDFCMRAEKIDGNYDFIVVFGGTNDFGHGDAEIGNFTDRTPDTFYGALHTLYNTLIKNHKEAKIVVMTPICRYDQKIDSDSGLTLEDYISPIKEVAKFYNLPIFDVYMPNGIAVMENSLLADGLHPNNDGHKKLARLIISFLQNNF